MAIHTFLVVTLFHTRGSSGLAFVTGLWTKEENLRRAVERVRTVCRGRAGHFQLKIHRFWLVGRWTSYSCSLERAW